MPSGLGGHLDRCVPDSLLNIHIVVFSIASSHYLHKSQTRVGFISCSLVGHLEVIVLAFSEAAELRCNDEADIACSTEFHIARSCAYQIG